MAQKLEFLTSDLAMMVQPAEGELEQYFADNSEAYRAPDRMTFSQVYFDPDSRGNRTLEDAAEALLELQAAGVPTEDSMQVGDGFMLQRDFVSVTGMEAARQMGSGFVEAVVQLEPGAWHGPVLSGYGVHLVYLYSLEKSPPAMFEDVKALVPENWQMGKREQFNADFLENLKTRYEIVIDEIPSERLHRIRSVQYINERLDAMGVPVMKPAGGHAIFVDAKKMLSHIPPHQYPAQALAVALYIQGGIRGVEIGSFMFGRQPDGPVEQLF